jgi:DNA repair protein RecN (Recombination protein N)
MLRELIIKDFAIIDQIDISFQDKMTVITGETGAGKSIVIDALGILAGNRASQEFIRQGTDKFVLQGLFDLPADVSLQKHLQAQGISLDDRNLILQREYAKSGHGVCRINGTLVTRGILRQVGQRLIDIHGQNEQQSLLQVENHLRLLDQFDSRIQPQKAEYQKCFAKYQAKRSLLNQRKKNEQSWNQRVDMLKFQVEEITDAALKMGEEEKLTHEKERLENFQLIQQTLAQCYQLLTAEPVALTDQLGNAMQQMEAVSQFSPELKKIASDLANAYYLVQDISHDLSKQNDLLEWDEGRLDEINERLELIHQLEHKYGSSIPDILDYHQKITTELKQMQTAESSSDELAKQVKALYTESWQLADRLAKTRQQAAQKLKKAVHLQLTELYMNKAVFEVKIKHLPKLTSNGFDQVEFYIQTNPGEKMGPLVKIASGGELSRVMLALKSIFAVEQNITSIIFDEVDTGVSGRVAQAIAEKILQLSQKSQVLCITHLPQVAAVGKHHLLVKKSVKNNRTKTIVILLNHDQRIQEIARMLAGSQVTALAIKHAEEMLKLAKSKI